MQQDVNEDQDVNEPASWQAFHGVNGEIVGAHHEEDGVMIRADFQGSKLSASTVRKFARHLNSCAALADDWMRDAANPGPGRCRHGSGLHRCILTTGHPGVHDPGPDSDGHAPGCQCRYCFNEPEPDGWSFLVGPVGNLTDTLGAVRLTTSVTNAPEPVRTAVRKLADEITVWQRGMGPQHRPDSVTKL